eukprot:SAG22_NODE_1774_length_3609_cov_3.611681_2_plen_107_part_00
MPRSSAAVAKGCVAAGAAISWSLLVQKDDAIYSCSATLVDGVPTIVYPGLCESSDWAGGICKTWPGKGATLGIAMPANRSDPLSIEWKKAPFNPIANSTGRDPSDA